MRLPTGWTRQSEPHGHTHTYDEKGRFVECRTVEDPFWGMEPECHRTADVTRNTIGTRETPPW